MQEYGYQGIMVWRSTEGSLRLNATLVLVTMNDNKKGWAP
jgi:hypothetical protein